MEPQDDLGATVMTLTNEAGYHVPCPAAEKMSKYRENYYVEACCGETETHQSLLKCASQTMVHVNVSKQCLKNVGRWDPVKTREETCDILMENWIHPYGAPLAIQSDNGSQFTAELTSEMMKCVDILQIHSSSYHPHTNGLVERQNRTLILMLRTVCSRRQDDWDVYLGRVMCAYNSTRHSTTGFSPFMLWHGREN